MFKSTNLLLVFCVFVSCVSLMYINDTSALLMNVVNHIQTLVYQSILFMAWIVFLLLFTVFLNCIGRKPYAPPRNYFDTPSPVQVAPTVPPKNYCYWTDDVAPTVPKTNRNYWIDATCSVGEVEYEGTIYPIGWTPPPKGDGR